MNHLVVLMVAGSLIHLFGMLVCAVGSALVFACAV